MKGHAKILAWALLLALAGGSCTPTGSPDPPAPRTGRLAVLGADGNVAVIDRDGSGRTLLTSDAGDTTAYFQPIWAPDGHRVTFARGSTEGTSLITASVDEGTASEVPTSDLAFYTYWSPDGSRLAFLNSAPGGGIDLGVTDNGEAVPRVLATGQPLYFSWAPDSARVVAHIGTERLEYLTLDGESTAFDLPPGTFQAPAWTDAGIFSVSPGTGNQQITLGSDDGVVTLARSSGIVSLVAAPAGDLLAVQGFSLDGGDVQTVRFQPAPLVPLNRVVVIDAVTGNTSAVTDTPAIAFFWSPDGAKLLILTTAEGTGMMRWSVWVDGTTTAGPTFRPSATFVRDFLPFFDQYHQSMTLWSPGADAFAFPGAIGDESGIWVQPIDGSAPTRVADGAFVSWST